MREFNKWIDKERPAHQWQKVNYTAAAKEGWKAALEWVEDLFIVDGDKNIRRLTFEIEDIINRELRDGS